MADLKSNSTSLVSSSDLSDLRAPLQVLDNKSKTRNWLLAQIHERVASIEAYKSQILHLQGATEVKEDELVELQARLQKLDSM